MTIDDLCHIEGIKQLKARYCRLIDSRAWDQFADLFVEDATFEGFKIVPAGIDAAGFVSKLREALEGSLTVHHCHTPEIRLIGSDAAIGIWAMTDVVEWPEPKAVPVAPMAKGFVGYGFYEERYQRIEGVWRIAFMRLARTRVDPIEPDYREPPYDPFAHLGGFTRPNPNFLEEGRAA